MDPYLDIGFQKTTVTSPTDLDLQRLEGKLYAVALESSSESLVTAHTKDLQLFRDAIVNQQHATVLDHNTAQIQPYIPLQRQDLGRCHQQRQKRIGMETTNGPKTEMSTFAAPVAQAKPYSSDSQSRKPTTANAFFSNSSISKDTGHSGVNRNTDRSSNNSSSTTHAETRSGSATRNANISFFGSSTPTTVTTTANTTKNHEDLKNQKLAAMKNMFSVQMTTPPNIKSVRCEEKENAPNLMITEMSTSGIGNADDFVGDADEDEDFLEEEKLRHNRQLIRQQQEAEKNRQQTRNPERDHHSISVSDIHNASIIQSRQPIDDDKNQLSSSQPATVVAMKRRKKLVNKTTMDEHGYLHTETHVEWEDISVVDEPHVETKKIPVKNTKTLKQGSLVGFFSRK